MRIDSLFEQLLRKLDPDDAAMDQALRRAERVAGVLSNDPSLGVLMTRVGGSCEKRTAVAPMKDVDLFVYLDEAAWRRRDGEILHPQTVLRSFVSRLERTFRKHIQDGDVSLRRQDHSVGIRYLREGAVAIDVVPALWADRNRAEIIRIPERSSGQWRITCILRQIRLLEKYDAPNRYLRRSVRLLKHWRNRHRLLLPSYALELLCIYEALRAKTKHPRAIFVAVQERIVESGFSEPVRITDYVPAAENKPPRAAEVAILDPAVPGNNVASELGAAERRAVIAAARLALDRLHAAEYHMSHDQIREGGVAFRAAFARKKRRATKLASLATAKTETPPPPAQPPAPRRSLWSRLLG